MVANQPKTRSKHLESRWKRQMVNRRKAPSRRTLRLAFCLTPFLCLLACSSADQGGEAGLHADRLLTNRDQLFGVAAVDPDQVWIVGEFGIILHSNSAGSTWVLQDSGTPKPLMDVDFANPNQGGAVGASGSAAARDAAGPHKGQLEQSNSSNKGARK